MKFRAVRLLSCNLCLFGGLCAAVPATAQDVAAVWNGISQAEFDSGKFAKVSNLTLTRDRIRITLSDGQIQFARAVAGLVFGAAFVGRGNLQVSAPNTLEAQQLRQFTGQDELNMEFSEATFSFTDSTYEEVRRQVQWTTAPDEHLGQLYQHRQQEREDLGAEVLPRLFKGVLSADHQRTAYFTADLKTGQRGWVTARLDALEPEEIVVGRWGDYGPVKLLDNWMSFPAGNRNASEAFRDPLTKDDVRVLGYQIDGTVTTDAELSATTQVHLEERASGERVLLFALDSNLRVDVVKDEKQHPLAFWQARERKERLQSYGDYLDVLLPAPTQAGQSQTLAFHYAGKRVVRKEGSGNYFCESFGWYPTVKDTFATRSDFQMMFHSPKQYVFVATGDKVGETREGNSTVSTWKSPIPLAVAGFAFGDFKVYIEKAGEIEVDVYANEEPDAYLKEIKQFVDKPLPVAPTQQPPRIRGRPPVYRPEPSLAPVAALGSLSPAAMAKTMALEMANNLRLFEAYYGPYPYRHLAVTNIPYNYGQGWPMLLYLSALTFLDEAQRHQLGLRNEARVTDFFRAHETSHQWWGQRVGWKSYHDQWLSEGFAQFSGNLYTGFRENWNKYLERLRQDKEELFTKDRKGHVYESVGPVWMGKRLSSSESPGAYGVIVYNKGGYVLHMLRMMMYDPRSQNPDERFQAMMHEFCRMHENQPASTEEFKAVAEKYMIPQMDLDSNQRLDWFFNQYVYGTGIPHYQFFYHVQDAGGGKWKVSGEVDRTGVPDNWKNILPVYMHSRGKVERLGFLRLAAKMVPFQFTLPFKPDKLSVNDNEDILAEIEQ